MEHNIIHFGVGVLRVSSTKQGLQGDSPKDQKNQIIKRVIQISSNIGNTIKIVKWFELVKSASGDLDIQPIQEVIKYCKEHNGKIKFLFIKSIDRITRAGGVIYGFLQKELAKYGTEIIDVAGIINNQSINTLQHLNISYEWSNYRPTYITQILEAERAKGEVRDILTRMIGAEINYVRLGYAVRQAPIGYVNEKIDTIHGKRTIRKPHPIEAKWIIAMYELRAQGNLTDEQIVKEINLMGYKSRTNKLHDNANPKRIIGNRGNKLLTVKQMIKFIQNPIYAGVNSEKWNEQPIKTKFNGLVSIDLFNRANRGKISIIEDSDNVSLYKGKPPIWQQKKNKNNPNYPYKPFVLCPICRRPLLGSANRGKSGEYYAAYHCNRGHYFRIPLRTFNETIENFCKKIKFNEEFKKRFRDITLEEWNKRVRYLTDKTIDLETQIIAIKGEIINIKDKIKTLSSPTAIKLMENDIDELEIKKAELTANLNNKEDEQVEIETLINYTAYYMEHLHELLLGGSNKQKNAPMFGLLFDETPSYKELVNGTPQLSPLFKLNEAFISTKKQSVSLERLELSTNALRGHCSTS